MAIDHGCDDYRRTTRRSLLVGAGITSVAWMTRSALAQVGVRPGRLEPDGDILISIFLRGGADGMSIVVPYGEDAYHRQRPNIGLARPNDHSAAAAARCLDLDGFFGLNPALSPLLPLYRNGQLGIVHAAGSGDQTRSHFEAMNLMERGLSQPESSVASGWLARHLGSSPARSNSPLRAVAISPTMPDSLRGATDALAIESLDRFRLDVENEAQAMRSLQSLYEGGKDAMAQAGRETLQVLETLNRLDPKSYRPSNAAAYPASDLGQGLRQVAFLIRANVGLEVAALDKGGWDTHVVQGATNGLLAGQLQDLGACLAAFAQDLGTEMRRVSVVVQTEFGRRLYENTSLGTDHGRASVMLLLGGGFAGGKVHAKWPGLEDSQLEPPGDLRVTTDYRDVLAEVLTKRVKHASLGQVFPGYVPVASGFVS